MDKVRLFFVSKVQDIFDITILKLSKIILIIIFIIIIKNHHV